MKLGKEQLGLASRRGARAGGACLSDEVVQRAARGELESDERDKVIDHLISCSDCAEAVQVVRSLNGWAREAAGEKIRRRIVPFEKRRLLAFAAVALLAVATGIVWETQRRGVAPRPEVLRGPDASQPTVELSPRDGEKLHEPPQTLSVLVPPDPGSRYVTTLFDSDLAPIWRSEESGSLVFEVPALVRNGLKVGRCYHWRVAEVQGSSGRTWPLWSFELVGHDDPTQ